MHDFRSSLPFINCPQHSHGEMLKGPLLKGEQRPFHSSFRESLLTEDAAKLRRRVAGKDFRYVVCAQMLDGQLAEHVAEVSG